MQFHEFGNSNEKTLLLIHGMASTWKQSFSKVIPELSNFYHVIAIGLDGHDPEENTDFISRDDEAQQLVDFIINKLNGNIYAIYGSSLGIIISLCMFFKEKVKVEYMIFDGLVKTPYFGIFTNIMNNFIASLAYKMAHGKYRIFLKLAGITPNMLEDLMYTGVSKKTLKNCCYAAFTYFKHLPPIKVYTNTHTVCWYGEKEKSVPSGINKLKLRSYFPNLVEKCYKGYAHGEILEHPEQFCSEIRSFIS